AAWQGLATDLGSCAVAFSALTAGLTGSSWQGAASVAMLDAVAPYSGWLRGAAVAAEQAASQAGRQRRERDRARTQIRGQALPSRGRGQDRARPRPGKHPPGIVFRRKSREIHHISLTPNSRSAPQ
ncbi:PPE domain-containing protein, partial [Mycobacterium gordonae]|uniref:PPE domain-containing protein n=1 Tax=Mycobacterium gordonae TaxID=1778 RepID=UPI000B2C156F